MRNKILKVISFTIIILSVYSLLALNASAEAIVSISGSASAPPNHTVTVPIYIKNVTNLGSGTIIVSYNPYVVHVTKAESGTGNALMVQAWSADNSTGMMKIVAWNVISPVSGDVIFANVTYKAVGMSGSSSPLNLKVRDLTDYNTYAQIPYSVSNGSFKVSYKIPAIIEKIETYINKSGGVHNINFTNVSERVNRSEISPTTKNIVVKVLDVIKKLFPW